MNSIWPTRQPQFVCHHRFGWELNIRGQTIQWPMGEAVAALLQDLYKKGVDETAASPEPEYSPVDRMDPTARG